MTTDSNNHISGSGNQQFQDCSIGGDLHIKTEIKNVSKNDQDENYDNLSQFERLEKAIVMTKLGLESLSTNREKALDLFYKAQRCYPKLPEPYELAGNILQKPESYLQAVDMFNKAKKYYNDVRSIYSDIDPDDLRNRNEEFDLEERINSINDNVKRIDNSISYLNSFMKKHILVQKLFNWLNF